MGAKVEPTSIIAKNECLLNLPKYTNNLFRAGPFYLHIVDAKSGCDAKSGLHASRGFKGLPLSCYDNFFKFSMIAQSILK